MIKSVLGLRLITLLTLLSLFAFADSWRFTYIQREIVLERLHSCPKKDIDRKQQLQTYFTQAGCTGAALTFDQPNHSTLGGNRGQPDLPYFSPPQIDFKKA